ncbi:MAG: NAD(P)/FAD-dependent oxidoreductase [Rubrimonas sp.]|uniref:NAD(P)/FAD-dependent oxidoreductase n=1 Tax=Rubrimonas sp. TaxID=2036015 RepID=UPI002FDE9118
MKIAIIGSGAAGLGSALALSDSADVTVFEKDDRVGGHANTVEIEHTGARIAVDTGFIVYNNRNYPNLSALFETLGVATKWSDMSFGFSLGEGALEYACDNLDKVFAQRRNIFNPRYVMTMRQVLRFCKIAPTDLAEGRAAGRSLGDWLAERGFSEDFRERFILPMGGAIWSTPTAQMTEFPAESFLRFFANHDLYTGLDPAMRWRTVDGGSREYVRRVVEKLGQRVRVGAGVVEVRRDGGKAHVRLADGSEGAFDHAILCCHGPQAAALLADKDAREAEILGAFRTSRNRAVLHSDARLMPVRRKVWSSWNLIRPSGDDGRRPVAVSYWMNRLQSLDRTREMFVTLNPHIEPDAAKVFAEFDYAHPLYDAAAFAAQTEIDAIQGRGGVWFAGAWLGYGFHEDALRAGLRVANALGARPGWAKDVGAPLPAQSARVAA